MLITLHQHFILIILTVFFLDNGVDLMSFWLRSQELGNCFVTLIDLEHFNCWVDSLKNIGSWVGGFNDFNRLFRFLWSVYHNIDNFRLLIFSHLNDNIAIISIACYNLSFVLLDQICGSLLDLHYLSYILFQDVICSVQNSNLLLNL